MFSHLPLVIIGLAICLPLITALPAPADTSQIAVLSSAFGGNEDAENTSLYMEKSPREIRRRAFDFLHGTVDFAEEVVNRLAFGLFGIPPSSPRGSAPPPNAGSGAAAPAAETPKL